MVKVSEKIRDALQLEVPNLWDEVNEICARWLNPVLNRLKIGGLRSTFPKTFADPVWRKVTLLPWELELLDSAMMQRLRGVRQLGMVHFVYPAATHDRLEHSLGTVEAASRILDALERTAHFRGLFGQGPDREIKGVDDVDRYHIRLAALLHDIGHGPFSHATESLVGTRYEDSLRAVRKIVESHLDRPETFCPSELLAAMFVLSRPAQAVLNIRSS